MFSSVHPSYFLSPSLGNQQFSPYMGLGCPSRKSSWEEFEIIQARLGNTMVPIKSVLILMAALSRRKYTVKYSGVERHDASNPQANGPGKKLCIYGERERERLMEIEKGSDRAYGTTYKQSMNLGKKYMGVLFTILHRKFLYELKHNYVKINVVL